MKDDKQSMHHFKVEDAVLHGVDKAVILSNLRFWLTKKRDSNTHKYDGYYWVYNTAKELAELFPYFTQSKIQRLLKQLEEDGVLLVGNYNKVKYDRTRWYSLSEFCTVDNCNNHNTELNNGNNDSVEPIPDTKHLLKTNINTNTHFEPNILFDVFWDLYDYKKNKSDCITKWHSMTDEERTLTIESLDLYIKSTPDKTYRKYPLNYLENECWNDEHIVLVDNQNIAHSNKYNSNNAHNNDVFSASHKEFEPVITTQDTNSTKHTKDDLECNLEALGISSDNSAVDIVALSSQVHWSELKARGMLKNPVNTNAVIPNTDIDDKINDFLARNSSKGSKRFDVICEDIA